MFEREDWKVFYGIESDSHCKMTIEWQSKRIISRVEFSEVSQENQDSFSEWQSILLLRSDIGAESLADHWREIGTLVTSRKQA